MNHTDLQITVRIEVSSLPVNTYTRIKLASVEQQEAALGTDDTARTDMERIVADTMAKALAKLDLSQKIIEMEQQRALIAEDAK
tara:strand:- start:14060 stop:14311 length:252 start_codon:yes stop_codon:yes gene_type:complete